MNAGPLAAATDRAAALARLRERRRWDLAVIGGGATGLGIALDAAARGWSVVCVDSHDFAGGTSSRATKLVHGGVRYLAQGDIGLVREALRERAALLDNAPHVAQRIAFVMPGYHWWERGFYGVGLKAYDALAGRAGLGGTEWLTTRRVEDLLPGVRRQGLWGGVRYWDGQFDDARLAVVLARSAAARGALLLNHAPAVRLLREGGGAGARVRGLVIRDDDPAAPGGAGAGEELAIQARCVVNATGVWVDGVRALDGEPGAPPPAPMVRPSQGVHLVVDRGFLPGGHALLVPKTADGRVLFAVPWLGKVVLGTTDTPREDTVREPAPFAEEVRFILDEAARYLERAPRREDVRSVWVGLRPLVREESPRRAAPVVVDRTAVREGAGAAVAAVAAGDANGDTKTVSREHTVAVAASGLVTVTGGKWTTYRAMAEDVLAQCIARGLLDARPGGVTVRMPLVGAAAGRPLTEPPGEHLYGSDAPALRALPGSANWLWRDGGGGLTEAMVRFAVRHEYARSVEDVLARRSRLLFLDAAEAERVAPAVAAVVAEELGSAAADVSGFVELARAYRRLPP